MSVLVINCGSTSIKIAAVDPKSGARSLELKLERLGSGGDGAGTVTWQDGRTGTCDADHGKALAEVLPQVIDALGSEEIAAVGHRVVHGGDIFSKATLINESVEQDIEKLSALAPLHNPVNLAGIRATRERLANVPQVAVFDTAFHSTLPTRSKLYAIDQDLAEKHTIRRFGFHGTSHQFVASRAASFLGENLVDLRVITCHLGGGCSLAAVEYGRSIETSMGLTPLEGLVMGTRSGDIDPGAIIQLMRAENYDADQLDRLLNKESGLKGLSGFGNDMRDIEAAAAEGDKRCQQTLQVFCHRLRKYIGGYAAVMGGVDVIAFTGGIGENSSVIRHRATQRLDFMGSRLDESANREIELSNEQPVATFSQPHSRVRLLAVKTDEMLAIAKQVAKQVASKAARAPKSIPVAISARHVHLTQETVEELFGPGHVLTEYKPLSQPGQFACNEQVTLIGPKRSIERVRVLGPARSKNQIEISRTDEFFLGLDAPVRASGNIENTPGITLEGSDERTVDLDQGVICALRHIHMTPEDAEAFGVQHGDMVEVEVGRGSGRSLTFGDVLIRVKSSYALEMHIDTDEGNAAELKGRDVGVLEETGAEAALKKRG